MTLGRRIAAISVLTAALVPMVPAAALAGPSSTVVSRAESALPSPPPTVTDPQLRACLEAEIREPFRGGSDWTLASLNSLTCHGVDSLAGLEGAKELKGLEIDGSVTDLSPLSGLTRLSTLSITRSSVTDLTPLAQLKALEQLDLSGNPVHNLRPLADLDKLVTLRISDTEVDDLSPIASLKSLRELHAEYANIEELSAVAELRNLSVLDLTSNSISDPSPLSELTSLRELNLDENHIADVTSLKPLLWSSEISVAHQSIALPDTHEETAVPNPVIGFDGPIHLTRELTETATDQELEPSAREREIAQLGGVTKAPADEPATLLTFGSPGATTLVWEQDLTDFMNAKFSGQAHLTVTTDEALRRSRDLNTAIQITSGVAVLGAIVTLLWGRHNRKRYTLTPRQLR